MKRISFLVCLLHVIMLQANAQNEENIWAFGMGTGLNFSATVPVPTANQLLPTREGSASICDASGRLLFYSDGYWVWDKNDFLMPALTSGVSGFKSPISASVGYPPLITWQGSYAIQGAAICGMPNNPGKYYLFSLSITGQLFYSQIDMSLNSGNGDLVPGKMRVYLDGGLCEKMTVVKGCNNIWLIVRSLAGNTYKAFEINDTGIVSTPVLSNVGLLPSDWYRYGVIKFSPDGLKMAAACSEAYHKKGGVELYNFDPVSGKLSNPFILDSSTTHGYYYGACFSPDNTKLYASTSSHRTGYTFYPGSVHQFDVSLSSAAAMIASNTTVFNDNVYLPDNLGDLKRGKDGKIYFGSGAPNSFSAPFMHCINFPNLSGTACGMTPNAIAMPLNAWTYRGLPNDIAILPPPDTVHHSYDITACFADSVTLTADTGKHYRWSNGGSRSNTVLYVEGIYGLSFINASCQYEIDSYHVRFVPLPVWGAGHSCPGAAQGKAGVAPAPGDTTTFSYKWSDDQGNIIHQNTTRQADSASGLDTGKYFLSISSPSGCDTTVSVFIQPLPVPVASMIADSIACKGMAVRFTNTSPAPVWKWYFGKDHTSGERTPEYTYYTTGTYTAYLVVTNIEGCTDTAQQAISVRELKLSLTADNEQVDLNDRVTLQSSSDQAYVVEEWQPAYLFDNPSAYRQQVIMDTTHTFVIIGRSEDGCVDSATVAVTVNPTVFMPNAFTPNGDGINDRFRPVAKGYIFIRYFEVYNRYGQQVYQASGSKALEGWDGTFNGEPVELGTYYYHINLETDYAGTISLKGDVIVIR